MLRRDVAADRPTPAGIARSARSDRYDKDVATNLGDHEPVGGRKRGIEQWVAVPDVADVVQPEVRVLEQVSGLIVNFERIIILEQIEIQQLPRHTP
jgi:hypothetical protein